MAAGLGEVREWCDCIVVTQQPGPEAAGRIAAAGKPVLDLAGTRTAPREARDAAASGSGDHRK
jgi:hypothetical protein